MNIYQTRRRRYKTTVRQLQDNCKTSVRHRLIDFFKTCARHSSLVFPTLSGHARGLKSCFWKYPSLFLTSSCPSPARRRILICHNILITFIQGMEHFNDTENMTREELLNALQIERQKNEVWRQKNEVERQKNEVERQKNAALRFVLGVARALAQRPLPVELDYNLLSPRRLARVKWRRSMQTCRSCSPSPDWFSTV